MLAEEFRVGGGDVWNVWNVQCFWRGILMTVDLNTEIMSYM